jgi:hypothetical protein
MSKLHIVTVATSDEYYFNNLIESCKKNGNDLVVLGYGEKWQGFSWKFSLMIEYLKKINKNDIVCFVDGYDVVCTRNLNELINEFNKLRDKYNCRIIVSEHKIINKNYIYELFENTMYTLYFGTCNNKFLNSGTYMGYAHDLLDILSKVYNILPSNSSDDQILFTKYCQLHSKDIYIDTYNEIFLVIADPYNHIDKHIKFENNKVLYNNKNPFFVHGPAETYLDNIIINLGYNYDYNNKVCDKLARNFYKKIYFRINNTSFYIKFLLLLIFLLFIFIIYYIFFRKMTNNNKINKVIFSKKIKIKK